jgi:hypothetical protein
MDIPTSLLVLFNLTQEGLTVVVPKLQNWGLVARRLTCPKCKVAELVPWRDRTGPTAATDNQARCACDNYGTVVTWDAGSIFDRRLSRIPFEAKLLLLYTFAISLNCKQATEVIADKEGILPELAFTQKQAQSYYNVIRGYVSRHAALQRMKLGGPELLPFVPGEKGIALVADPRDPSAPPTRRRITVEDESQWGGGGEETETQTDRPRQNSHSASSAAPSGRSSISSAARCRRRRRRPADKRDSHRSISGQG